MRFKAVFPREMHSCIAGVVGALERIESGGSRQKRRAVLQLTPAGVSFALLNERAMDDVLAFAELSTSCFVEFRIQSATDDCIFFSLALGHLSSALTSARDSPTTSLKLAKRNGAPCVVVELEASSMRVAHDIPVRLMRQHDMRHHTPPEYPPPRVMLEMPRTRTLRTVVERLKAIGDRLKGGARFVDVRVESVGTLGLRVVTDTTTIKTFFSDLTPVVAETPACDADQDEDDHHHRHDNNAPREPVSVPVRVDSKKLAQAIQCYQLDFDRIVCCPIEGHALVLDVTLAAGAGTATFYVPVVHVDEDEVE